jgi:hypothetical protein
MLSCYDRTGDFDFTLIDQKGRTFHQRATKSSEE